MTRKQQKTNIKGFSSIYISTLILKVLSSRTVKAITIGIIDDALFLGLQRIVLCYRASYSTYKSIVVNITILHKVNKGLENFMIFLVIKNKI